MSTIASDVRLSLVTENYSFYKDDWRDNLQTDELTRGGIQFTSGRAITDLKVELLDSNGNVMVSDNSSIA